MPRAGSIALATIALGASGATAEPTEIGAYVGPRVFSDDSRLGFVDDSRGHPSLEPGIAFGGRVSHPLLRWLVPELELAFARTRTTPEAEAPALQVTWLEPRLHVRFELLPGRRLQPFVIVGGGAPIVLVPAGNTITSGIVGEGYAGGGVRFDTGSVTLRLDARVMAHPGIELYVTREYEIGLGIEVNAGWPFRRGSRGRDEIAPRVDTDRDGVVDANDRCPGRTEDVDNFEDLDGCPDIDNDLDRVLDIADRCRSVPETYNGYLDDDGCPDAAPPDLDGLRGPIEGLLYAEGETEVNDSAIPNLEKIAKTMAAHPTIRVVLIGHADDREASNRAVTSEPPDLAASAEELSLARAEGVKAALGTAGVLAARILVEGRGFEEPVTGGSTPKERLANRRVEIKLHLSAR